MTIKLSNLLPGVQLQPHQQAIADKAKKEPVRMLMMHALGSGKTLTGIAAAESFGEPYTAVVPASLRENLRKEQQQFTDKKLPGDVVSYTQMAKDHPIKRLGTLIFDEAHRLRNPNSKQTEQANRLAHKAKQLVLLTGTPVVNEPADIAPLVSMLTKKDITPKEFTQRFISEKQINPGLLQRLRGITPGIETDISNEDELKNLLKGHVDYYAPTKPSVPTHFEDHEIEMSKPQSELYKMMFDKLPWVVRWKLQRNYPLSREEFLRMQAFLTGPRQVGLSTMPFLKDKNPEQAFKESTKLQKALELLQERLKDDRTKALVFSNFIDAGLTPYADALGRAGVPHAMFHGGLDDRKRKQLVDDYNNNRIRVALLGPSGAEGLSFRGTQLIQLLDPYWHNVRTRQQQGRGIRFDSHLELPEDLRNVTVQRFIAKLPLSFKDKLLQSIGFDRSASRIGADDILRNLSARKDKLNDKFINLLQTIGSDKTATAPPVVSLAIKESSSNLLDPIHAIPFTAGGLIGALAMIALQKRMKKLPEIDPAAYLYSPPYMQPDAPIDKKKLWKDRSDPIKYAAMTSLPVTMNKPQSTVTLDHSTGPKVGILDRLKEIKGFSDKRHWQAKHMKLRDLMDEYPFQFDITDDPGVSPRFVSVTHWPTSFRMHFPRELVPSSVYSNIRSRKKEPIFVTPDAADIE